ncbi:MAG: VCBS repeat-containing protein [Bacteroidetes bacterium]|nr:VCBS repeat-containing protein [Bacteroidota bacterium]
MTKPLIISFLFLFISGELFAQAPVITSFSPASGPVGTTVTIDGFFFSASANNNVVYFGGVRANVTSASATSLTVSVPVGTTYKPISVLNTTNNLAGYSTIPFIVTADSKTIITGSDIDPGVNFTSGYLPQSVCMGDIDGDGKLDIVVANATSNTVSIFRNIAGKGVINSLSLFIKVDIPVGNSPSNVMLQDLDGDGKPELIVTNKQDNNVSVFHNNAASGTISVNSFGPKTDFAVGTAPVALGIGDIDRDGKPDIVVSSSASGKTSILLNQTVPGSITRSSFAPKFDVPSGFDALVLADLDYDGSVDIAGVVKGGATVSVLHNAVTTSGVLNAASFDPLTVFTCGMGTTAIIAADINNDGKPDLITADGTDNTISILQNSTNGTSFTGPSFLPRVSFATGTFPYQLAAGDIDGDGLLDIVVPDYNGNSVSLLRNTLTTGAINATSFTQKLDLPTGQFTSAAALGDIDGDGRPDIVVTNNLNTVTVFRNDPSNPPVISSISPLHGPVGTNVTITGSNFGKTAANNIVFFGATRASIASASATKLVVTVPPGSTFKSISVLNTETQRSAYSTAAFDVTYSGNTGIRSNDFSGVSGFLYASNNHMKVQLADIDGDGKPDLVTGDITGKNVSIRLNTGSVTQYLTGQFTTPLYFDGGDSIDQMAIADIDGDGKPDVLTTNLTTHTLSILKNISTPGNVAFQPRLNFIVGGLSNASRIAVADINMDGKADVVITQNNGYAISIFKNSSSAGFISFGAEQDISANTGGGLSIGDMDGDGKPDLVVTLISNSFVDNISIIRNTSNNNSVSFADPVSFTSNADSFTLADLDNDGKLDVVVDNGGSAYVLRNTSVTGSITAASLGMPVNLNIGQNNSLGQYVADIDGDGKPDILLLNPVQSGTQTLSIYRNTTVGNSLAFSNSVDVVISEQPSDLAIGDVDGDGLPDLMVSETYNIDPVYYRPQTPFQSDPPQISSIIPVSGPAGSTVTISGNNFNPAASGNIVTFGDVNAHVTAASSNSLTVTVPNGATYKNVSVVNTANKRFAYSPAPFNVTFPSKNSITTADFNDPVFLHSSAANSYITLNDIDGDGKLDLVTISSVLGSQWKVTVFRNISNQGIPLNKSSFAQGVDFVTNGYTSVMMTDIDGDGKPDMLLKYAFGDNAASFYIRKNTSSTGSVSFDNPIQIAITNFSNVGTIADIDGDGLPDIIAGTDNDGKSISVLRNVYRGTPFSFDAPKSFPVNSGVTSLSAGDIDGDGKTDVVTSNENGTICILRNISTPGNITISSFAPYVSISAVKYLPVATLADIDGDGKTDIIVTSSVDSVMSILRNTSTPGGNISFAPKVDFKIPVPTDIVITDMDGDGKPDIIINTGNGPSIFRNISTAGSFTTSSLVSKLDVITGASDGTAIGDLDGDGKPDLVTIAKNVISLYQNNPHTPTRPTINGFAPLNATTGTIVTISGTDFTNATSVSFGGKAASSFRVASPKIITAIVAGGNSGTVSVTTSLGTATLDGFNFSNQLSLGPVITPLADTVKINLNSNGTKNITLADVATVTNATNATITVSPTSFNCLSTGLRTVTVKAADAGTAPTPAAVSFNHPSSVALDVSGNMYIADANNFRIRKITPAGFVSTFAGNGLSTDTDGPAASASFNTTSHSFLSTDPFGNIFLTTSNLVRKINSQGEVTTIAGSGFPADGYTYPGPEDAAEFDLPSGIAISPDGNMYVVNSGGNSVSKLTQTGIMTLLAGYYGSGKTDGTGMHASFTYPTGIAIDDAGNLYVADQFNAAIRKITSSGTVNTMTLIGPQAALVTPNGIATDHFGNIYVTDGNAIAKITSGGYITIIAGSRDAAGAFADGQGANAKFDHPGGLCVDNEGNVYVADYNNNRIRKIDPAGFVSTFAGGSQGYTDGNIGVAPSSAAALIKAKISGNLAITNTFADQNLPIDATARATIPDYTTNVTVTSYCSIANVKITQSPAAGTFLNAGFSQQMKITATDTSGLSVVKTFMVTADGSKTIPFNDFTVAVTSATCKGSSDGSITITAAKNLNYTATITGNGHNTPYPFTTSATISNLAAGPYSVCISVPGNSNYQQCYNLVITEPKDLSVYSTVDDANKNITLTLDGGTQYNIRLNNTTYTTNNSYITLPLADGNNQITVTTDRLCQGMIQKLINISGKISPYPVPFQNTLSLNLGNSTVITCL